MTVKPAPGLSSRKGTRMKICHSAQTAIRAPFLEASVSPLREGTVQETKISPLLLCDRHFTSSLPPSFTRMLSDLHPWALLLDEETGTENSCDVLKSHGLESAETGGNSIWPKLSSNLLSSQE